MLHDLPDHVRRRPLARRYGLLLTAFLLVTFGASAGECQTSEPERRDIHLRIDTHRTEYAVGDSITVRVAFVNTSGLPAEYIYSAPWELARLIVTDEQGRVVKSAAPPTDVSLTSSRHVKIKPYDSDHQLTWQLQEWFDLAHWGYRLRTPGRYTITGIPVVSTERVTHDLQIVRSNAATVTILP